MKKIVSKFLISGSGILASAFFGVILLKIISVKYGPEELGEFGIYRQLFQVLGVIITLGKGNALIQGLSKSESKSDFLTLALKYYFIILSILCFIILVTNGFLNNLLFNSGSTNLILSLPLILFFSTYFFFQGHCLAGLKKLGQSSILQTVPFLFMIFAAYFTSRADYIFLVSYFFSSVFAFIIARYQEFKPDISKIFKVSRDTDFEKTIISTLLTAITSLSVLLVIKVLIREFEGIENVGYFEASWNISLYSNMILYSGLNLYFLPRISSNDVNDQFLNQISNFIGLYSLVIFCIIFFNAELIVSLLYTDSFKISSKILQVLAIGELFRGFNYFFNFSLIGLKHRKKYIAIELFTNSILIFSYVIFLKHYGVLTSAYAFLFFNIIYFIINYLLCPIRNSYIKYWFIFFIIIVITIFSQIKFGV